MKRMTLTVILLIAGILIAKPQTDLLTNGDFETTPNWSNWSSASPSANFYCGIGPYSAQSGVRYIWAGDQTQSTGVNNLVSDAYQTITIPSNTTQCKVSFYASINTKETESNPYDYFVIKLRSTSGALLNELGYLSNVQGAYGIPGFQAWKGYYVDIPSSYFGQTVRVSLEFETDYGDPTIFRVDNVKVLATIPGQCTYSLSPSTYNCADASANTYNNVALVNTQTGCNWTATVTSGNTWLTTNSIGSGSGAVSIIVLQNTSASPRTGTIDVAGQSLTIIQPGVSCTYTISPSSYTCSDALANNYNNIAIVNTQTACPWTAVVTSGSSWMVCTSSGSGAGAVSIIVVKNSQTTPRTGTITIGGQTLTVTQPGSTSGLDENMESQLSIYPNPVSDILSISVPDKLLTKDYFITNQLGQLVLHGQIADKNTEINVGELTSGYYFLRINYEEGSVVKHFIKE